MHRLPIELGTIWGWELNIFLSCFLLKICLIMNDKKKHPEKEEQQWNERRRKIMALRRGIVESHEHFKDCLVQ